MRATDAAGPGYEPGGPDDPHALPADRPIAAAGVRLPAGTRVRPTDTLVCRPVADLDARVREVFVEDRGVLRLYLGNREPDGTHTYRRPEDGAAGPGVRVRPGEPGARVLVGVRVGAPARTPRRKGRGPGARKPGAA